jgi:hypothetical protein
MSRGLGRIERAVLQVLHASQEPYLWLPALQRTITAMQPSPPVSRERRVNLLASGGLFTWRDPQQEAIARAIRSLERKGLVRTGKDSHGRAHRKIVWLATREGPGEVGRFRRNTYPLDNT